ncbi:energy transducer TonB [Alteromonas halophila]|uniref:Protein TonB n=1 Tax=Alteromonas halophila TaxID=516698 RepID=A0A918MUV0_9ALTE|nr:energy transducer TonB [Alteromonas halophila]GGW73095.1 hypothetical protein GCM10007391_00790 [Alteromonas halophila]
MKGYLTALAAILATSVLSACSSSFEPLNISDEDVVRYKSRCGFHEKEFDEASMVSPLSRKDPGYPRKAARNGTQGYAKMEFDISESGKPVNINVIEAYPQDTFAAAAVTSLMRWQYPAEATACQSVEIVFRLK